MGLTFTDEQQEIRKAIIQFCRKDLNPGIIERDRDGLFSQELWEKCAAMRLMAMPYPEHYGGDEFEFITTAAAFHALGYACKDSGLVLAILSQAVCGLTINLFSSKEQASTLLPDLASGKLIYCQGITEPGSGSDAFAMKTSAIKNESVYILNGTKTMISNGPIADQALIYVITNPEKMPLARITCLCVSTTEPGFSRGKPFEKMGLRTLPNGELFFSDCRVSASSMIGREGQGLMMFSEVVEWERVLTSAVLLGQLERVTEDSIDYAKTRKSFGKPIAEYQAVSHKIAAMKMNSELGSLALYNAAKIKQNRKGAALESSVAKLFISESLKQACLDAVQIRGGYGYMTEYEVERDLRDSIASTIYSGTSEMQYNTIARLAGL